MAKKNGAGLTVEILKDIRAELKNHSGQLTQLREAAVQTNQRLDRVEQGLLDLGQFMKQITLDQARHERFHAQHADLLERDVADLKERVRKLEDRTGH